MLGFFFNMHCALLRIEFDDAVAFGVANLVTEHRRAGVPGRGALEHVGQVRAVEHVVTEREGDSGIADEAAATLVRTAFSTSVREAGDLSAGVFDRKGRMLAQAVTGTPGHINSMAEAVVHFLAKFPIDKMEPGDHYITNDPWQASGHLHDITVVSPTFHKGKPVALFANTIHVVDIGGRGFGASPSMNRVMEM